MLFKSTLLVVMMMLVAVAANQHERLSGSLALDVQEALGVQENPHDSVTEVPHSYFRGSHSLLSAADSISHGVASSAEAAAYGDLPVELVESSNTHEMVDAAYTQAVDPAFMLETASAEQQVESLDAIQQKAAHDAQEFDLGLIQTEEEVAASESADSIAPEIVAAKPAAVPAKKPAAPAKRAAKKAKKALKKAKRAAQKAAKKAAKAKKAAMKAAAKAKKSPSAKKSSKKSAKKSAKKAAPKKVKTAKKVAKKAAKKSAKKPAAKKAKKSAAKRTRKTRRAAKVIYNESKASNQMFAPRIRRRRATSAKKSRKSIAKIINQFDVKDVKIRASKSKKHSSKKHRSSKKRMSRIARKLRAARRRRIAAANLQYDPVTNTIIRHIHKHRYTRLPAPMVDAEEWSKPSSKKESFDSSASEASLQRAYLKLCKLQRALVRKWNSRARKAARKAGKPSTRHVLVKANLVSNKYRRASKQASKARRQNVNEASLLREKYQRHLKQYARAQRILASASKRLNSTSGKKTAKKASKMSFIRRGCKRAQHPKTGRKGWLCPKGSKKAAAAAAAASKTAAPKAAAVTPLKSVTAAAPKKAAAVASKAAAKRASPAKTRFAQLRMQTAAAAAAETASVIAAAHEAESFTQSLSDAQLMHDAQAVAEDADVALMLAEKKLDEADDFKF